jgi:DNA-binding Lrp family transcriptional regulator
MGRNKSLSTESIQESYTNNSTKYIKKLLDSINIKIISELLEKPTISSLALSKKLDIPLSTLQRRRARIEKAILNKTYTFNYKAFGIRVGDLIINVGKGKSDQVAQSILDKYKNNVTYCHTRIDLVHSVLAHVIYRDTAELFYLIEDIKAMQYVNSMSWSETVNVIGHNHCEVINAFFNK